MPDFFRQGKGGVKRIKTAAALTEYTQSVLVEIYQEVSRNKGKGALAHTRDE